jgi:hypothetical protein
MSPHVTPCHPMSSKHGKSANYNVIGQKKISWPNEAQGMPIRLFWPISTELANSPTSWPRQPRAPIPSGPRHFGFHHDRAINNSFIICTIPVTVLVIVIQSVSCWFRNTSHIVNGARGATIIPKITTRPPCRSTQLTCWVIVPPAATELSRIGNRAFMSGGGGAGGELPACQTRREVTGTMV